MRIAFIAAATYLILTVTYASAQNTDRLSFFVGMKRREKPEILKTFTEFTIEELRMMPMRRVLSLFSKEVRATFRGQSVRQAPKKKTVKKNATEPILTASIKPSSHRLVLHAPRITFPTQGFQQAMKRVFTPGPIKMVNVGKEEAGKQGKHQKKETVVFTKEPTDTQRSDIH